MIQLILIEDSKEVGKVTIYGKIFKLETPTLMKFFEDLRELIKFI